MSIDVVHQPLLHMQKCMGSSRIYSVVEHLHHNPEIIKVPEKSIGNKSNSSEQLNRSDHHLPSKFLAFSTTCLCQLCSPRNHRMENSKSFQNIYCHAVPTSFCEERMGKFFAIKYKIRRYNSQLFLLYSVCFLCPKIVFLIPS